MTTELHIIPQIDNFITTPSIGHKVIDNIYMKYDFIDNKLPLVITFGSLGTSVSFEDAEEGTVEPWGYKYIRSKGVNVLSFACVDKPNWYRSLLFTEYLSKLSPKLKCFPARLGYGASMGAYGISAFSNLLNIDRVLLLNPISTLNSNVVPEEHRFVDASNRFDWNGKYSDGAAMKATGYIVYDPLYKIDALHANRYNSLIPLRFPGVGHQMPKHLKAINLLNKTVTSFLKNKLSENEFFFQLRLRRTYPHYFNWLLSGQNSHLTSVRTKVVRSYQKKYFPEDAFLEKYKKEIKILKELVVVFEFIDNKLSELFNDILGNVIEEKSISSLFKNVELIRDSAIKYELENINLAYQLMKLAHLIRPNGPLIVKKLEEYRKIISGYVKKMG